MSKKRETRKDAEKPHREMTKRGHAQWQKQQRRQRFILISGVSIVAAAIILVMVGWYVGSYRPMHSTVIKVNDTEFDMSYYIDSFDMLGEGETADYYQIFAQTVIGEIQRAELIRQQAEEMGYTVSDDEARALLEESGLPVSRAMIDQARGQLLIEKLQSEYFAAEVPETAPQAHIKAMFLEDEEQAAELRAEVVEGLTSSVFPAATGFDELAAEHSLDDYSKENAGDIGWHPEEVIADLLGSEVPAEYGLGSEAGVLSQPLADEEKTKQLGYWLINVLEREGADADDAQVQAVLLGSRAEALEIRERLLAGEELAALAGEFSQDELSQSGGGEMGVVSRGDVSDAFDAYIFDEAAQIGEWSQPVADDSVTTTGGAWLVTVLEKEDDRELSAEDREFLIASAYNEWLASLVVAYSGGIESLLSYDDMIWATEQAAKS